METGNFNMIQRNIEKLEAVGIVSEVTGNKRNRIYRVEEILNLLEEQS